MNITCGNAKKSDIDSLKNLWRLCFDEKAEAADLFFKTCFSEETAYVAKNGEDTASALYLINGSINGRSAHYLCGASTHPDYRNRGIMGRLIEYSLESAKMKGDKFSVLFPADEGLYGFYRRFGYEEKCFAYVSHITRKELEFSADKNAAQAAGCDFAEIARLCFKNNFLDMSNRFIGFAEEYYKLYGARVVYNDNCFAFFSVEGNTADVFHFAYKENKLGELISLLLQKTSADSFLFTHKNRISDFKGCEKIKYGMIKRFDKDIPPLEEIYTGITLS